MKYLREKLLAWKNKFDGLSAKETTDAVLRVGSALLFESVGLRFLADGRRPLYSLLLLFVIVVQNILCVYTAWYYWGTNMIAALTPFSITAVSIPVSTHLNQEPWEYVRANNLPSRGIQAAFMYVKFIGPDRFRTRNLARFIHNYIGKDGTPTTAYELEQLQLIRRLPVRIGNVILLMIVTLALGTCAPVYAYFVKNEYQVATGVILPFIDPDTFEGFMANLFLASILAVAGLIESAGLEFLHLLINFTLEIMASLVVLEMRRFSEDVTANGFDASKHVPWIKDICVRLQDIEEYVVEFNYFAYWRTFLQPSLTMPCFSISFIAQYLVTSNCSITAADEQ